MRRDCIAVWLILGGLWTTEIAYGGTAVDKAGISPESPAGNASIATEATDAQQAEGLAHAIWINVPFVQQTKDGCGSATMAMVMHYWDRKQGLPIPADQDPMTIQSALFSKAAGGIYASSMEKYFEKAGFEAFAFHGEWRDLEHHLSLGRPLIAAIQASGAHGPLHYVVVVGIDPQRGFVYLNDPAQQKMLRISREGFESEWRATHDWTLLAVPKPAH